MITSDADLAAACGRWSAARVIGVDTEFVRERTYYPIPALIQVTDGDSVALVDPLRISDFAPLAAVLDMKDDLIGKKIVLVLSGGNLSLTKLQRILAR